MKNDQVDPHDVDPDYEDPEEYLNDEDQFNITERLTSLFPLIDINPRDDYVTSLELLEWHLVQGKKAMLHRSDREMESHDKNHDGLVSLEEYLPHVLGAEQGVQCALYLSLVLVCKSISRYVLTSFFTLDCK